MKILFHPHAYEKMKAYVAGTEYEISGFGKVEKTKETLLITDVKIFKQVVSSGNTVIDAMAHAEFIDELMQAGEDPGQWKLWWHSHVWMQAYFSTTDLGTIDEFDAEMPEDNWILSIVTNKMGNLYARIDVFEPIRCHIANLPWEVMPQYPTEVIDVSAEIKEKVSIHTQMQGIDTINWLQREIPFPRRVLSDAEREALIKQFNLPRNILQDGEYCDIDDAEIVAS